MSGAVTYEQCPNGGGKQCRCERCGRCNFRKHMAIHGPVYGKGAGSKPWGHEFMSKQAAEALYRAER
jgi:hypothetical protein